MKAKTNKNGYRIEWKKGTNWNDKSFGWYLECRGCGEMTRVGSEDLESVLCSRCVSASLKEFDEDVKS